MTLNVEEEAGFDFDFEVGNLPKRCWKQRWRQKVFRLKQKSVCCW